MRNFLNRFIAATCLCAAIVGCQSVSGLDSAPPLESTAADDATYRVGPGDHLALIVFGAPDPETGARRVQRGTVTAVDPLGAIDVVLDDGTEHRRNPDAEGQISHLSGGCRCSTPLYP